MLKAFICSKNGLVFGSLFLLICSVSTASDFDDEYSKLNTKQKTLLHECSTIHQVAKISYFYFNEYPESTSSEYSPVLELNRAQWKATYYGAGTVLKIFIDEKNRFGETTTKNVICGWSKGDYEMLFPRK